MSNSKILIVEDELVSLKALEVRLQVAGYQVVGARNGTAAVEAIRTHQPDLMVLDLNLVTGGSINGLSDGFTLLHYLRCTVAGGHLPVILHTAEQLPSVERRAREAGVHWIFRKGNKLSDLVAAVQQVLDREKSRHAA